ncbi:MAG: YcbK family protein [Alphaproteobacteria bacterium]
MTREALAEATKPPRRLKLFNANTKETFDGVYREGDVISAPAREALNHLLRDHHENETVAIDPALFDLIWNLQERYRAIGRGQVTINIHSGYRTKKTNDRLIPEGAAQSSLHLAGQAVDLTVQGYGIYLLGPQARRVATGGLGLYWADKFVHLDTGPRRFWYSRT